MMRTLLSAGMLILASLSPAVCQDFTAEQRAACKGDYDKYCKGTMPGGGRVIACLNKHYAQLTEACKKVVDAQKK
jgi:cysteine rich repeat protein